eukprot:TRINITY_DN14138_c0_g1_i1.p1 TRINITY_DN14138_c0_g1~~TRINITY_DN14138_c0_g1_i1.p1  ORF type:complete len:124 (-),score=22.27 TRINITY_DN14138_c0_g1_i1:220-546(-)
MPDAQPIVENTRSAFCHPEVIEEERRDMFAYRNLPNPTIPGEDPDEIEVVVPMLDITAVENVLMPTPPLLPVVPTKPTMLRGPVTRPLRRQVLPQQIVDLSQFKRQKR